MINDYDLDQALRNIDSLSTSQKEHVLSLIEEREKLSRLTEARTKFMPFVKSVWPAFIPGAHHAIMAGAFERVAEGKCRRLIINMAPRHTKSELASWLLPAWFLGRNPGKKIIQASANEDLASDFGRKVRNLVGGEYTEDDDNPNGVPYSEIFPKIKLSKDSKAAGLWKTNYGGTYFAVGVNGRVTGRGGDIVIIDDVHTEQEAKQAEANPEIYDAAYEWYKAGPRQRLQPGGSIVIVMTRWSKRDLTGRLIEKMTTRGQDEHGDDWEVIELPAILDEGTPDERPMWPGFWPLAELQATRTEIGPAKFRAQYQQQPTSEESAIIKKENWRIWGSDKETCPGDQHLAFWNNGDPPPCSYVMLSIDTALKKNQRADYSAFTVWGIFEAEDPGTGRKINHIIMLYAFKERLEFPTLKKRVKEVNEDWQPDTILIEDKGSGISLIQELRTMGIPVEAFGYGRGSRAMPNDKIARANMVADVFASGYVWRPDRRYAEEVAIECAEFPAGRHDDLVDSTVQAMLRFRSGGFITTANDDLDDEEERRYIRKRYY